MTIVAWFSYLSLVPAVVRHPQHRTSPTVFKPHVVPYGLPTISTMVELNCPKSVKGLLTIVNRILLVCAPNAYVSGSPEAKSLMRPLKTDSPNPFHRPFANRNHAELRVVAILVTFNPVPTGKIFGTRVLDTGNIILAHVSNPLCRTFHHSLSVVLSPQIVPSPLLPVA